MDRRTFVRLAGGALAGALLPGCGTDPRYTACHDFGLKACPDEPLFSDWIPLPPFPEDYPVRQALGEKVWWYNCMSAQFVLDFSNHFVDVQGMYMRIWPWLTRRYNFEGLLFWHTIYLYAHNEDPWTDQYAERFFCNGDGNMFYPGVPDKLAAGKYIPTPSSRLKLENTTGLGIWLIKR